MKSLRSVLAHFLFVTCRFILNHIDKNKYLLFPILTPKSSLNTNRKKYCDIYMPVLKNYNTLKFFVLVSLCALGKLFIFEKRSRFIQFLTCCWIFHWESYTYKNRTEKKRERESRLLTGDICLKLLSSIKSNTHISYFCLVVACCYDFFVICLLASYLAYSLRFSHICKVRVESFYLTL